MTPVTATERPRRTVWAAEQKRPRRGWAGRVGPTLPAAKHRRPTRDPPLRGRRPRRAGLPPPHRLPRAAGEWIKERREGWAAAAARRRRQRRRPTRDLPLRRAATDRPPRPVAAAPPRALRSARGGHPRFDEPPLPAAAAASPPQIYRPNGAAGTARHGAGRPPTGRLPVDTASTLSRFPTFRRRMRGRNGEEPSGGGAVTRPEGGRAMGGQPPTGGHHRPDRRSAAPKSGEDGRQGGEQDAAGRGGRCGKGAAGGCGWQGGVAIPTDGQGREGGPPVGTDGGGGGWRRAARPALSECCSSMVPNPSVPIVYLIAFRTLRFPA